MRFLTAEFGKSFPAEKSKKYTESYSTQHIVEKEKTEIIIGGLQDFSVYGVEIFAVNKNGGHSLPVTGVVVVTHVSGEENTIKTKGFERAPDMPDIRGCCFKEKVNDR